MQETDAYLEETRLWLRYAQGDLRAAEAAVRQPEFEPRHACFQAQQAAEKALKAVLVFLRRDVPRIHDLDALIDALPQDWPVVQEYPDLANLTDWAVNARYPLAGQEPTHEDAEEAVRQARAVLDSVQRDLIAHGFENPPQQDEVR
jgi:HEPN domain-containing protein